MTGDREEWRAALNLRSSAASLDKTLSSVYMSGLILRLKDVFAANAAPAYPVPSGEFVKGINFAGEGLTIEGYAWDAYRTALASGLSTPDVSTAATSVNPVPYAPPHLRRMLNTVIYKPHTLEITQVLLDGDYQVYLWIMENYQSDWHSLEVRIVGDSIATGIGKLSYGHWARYGAYPVTIASGALHLTITTHSPDVDAHLMGLSIFRQSA